MNIPVLYNNRLRVLFVFFIILCLNIQARDYFVKTNGISGANGLSWSTATSLDNALSLAQSGDVIHLAAGTYTPAAKVSGGSLDEDMTFEIKENISLIGGYPVNPVQGDVANKSNTTTLNGLMSGKNAFHVLTITAPVAMNEKVQLSNLTISGGNAGASNSGNVVINGLNYPRFNGGAIIIGRSTVEINYCDIIYNQSRHHTPGVYVFSNANVFFQYSTIANNTGTVNGGGLWNDGSIVTFLNCNISHNEIGGVGGGIYALNTTYRSKTNMYNTTINNNIAGHKAGYYGREKSVGLMINCTVYGNETKQATSGGSGISLYTNNQINNAAKLDIISTTVTGNSSVQDEGGGIRLNDEHCKLNIYNSVISGNTNQDVALFNNASYTVRNSVIADKVYNKSGAIIQGEVFVAETMIGSLSYNGGYNKTCRLLGANNPAFFH